MTNLNVEMVVLIISIIGVAFGLFNKLEKIWGAISDIKENFVKETECQHNRENCPCVKDMKYIKQEILHKSKFGD